MFEFFEQQLLVFAGLAVAANGRLRGVTPIALAVTLAAASSPAIGSHPIPGIPLHVLRQIPSRSVAVGIALVPFVLLAVSAKTLIASTSVVEAYTWLLFTVCLSASAAKIVWVMSADRRGSWLSKTLNGVACIAMVLSGIYAFERFYEGEYSVSLDSTMRMLPISLVLMLVVALLEIIVTIALVHVCRKSFTLGEAFIVADLVVLFVVDAVVATFDEYLPQTARVKRLSIHTLSQALILGVLLIGILVWPVLSGLNKITNKSTPGSSFQRACYFYAISVILVLTIIRSWTTARLSGVDPFAWLIGFIFDKPRQRIGLIAYWAIMAIAAVYYAGIWLKDNEDSGVKRKSNQSMKIWVNLKRKYFHGVALAMFVPGCIIDILRVGDIPPAAVVFREFLPRFFDSKDKSAHVVLSHIYLIFGYLNLNSLPILLALLGVVVLGVADTSASVVGCAVGRQRKSPMWNWVIAGEKSVEGTVAFIVSMASCCFALLAVCGEHSNGQTASTIITISILSGLLEASR
ncbi:hypothetical protein HDU84_005014 [Entophlyctis sp. JEL0112]|nr:hypothetical protein HDU84_005014 [Entophlyctis sp. JEL0112]